jgi:hypothetical protein
LAQIGGRTTPLVRILVIGGTGPTGLLIVRGLAGGGHPVTVLHRGWHERPETPAIVDHLHAEPYHEGSLSAALEGTSWDVVVAMHRRLPASGGTEELVRPTRSTTHAKTR